MKIKELKIKTKEEIERLLHEKKEELQQLGFDLVSGKVKNIRQMREIKKDIARMLTLLKQK